MKSQRTSDAIKHFWSGSSRIRAFHSRSCWFSIGCIWKCNFVSYSSCSLFYVAMLSVITRFFMRGVLFIVRYVLCYFFCAMFYVSCLSCAVFYVSLYVLCVLLCSVFYESFFNQFVKIIQVWREEIDSSFRKPISCRQGARGAQCQHSLL